MPSTLANPSPLGLFGFATACTINAIAKLSNSQSISAHFLAGIAFFGGGGAQILASTLQFFRNEMHSALVFAVFGFHWWNTALWYLLVSRNDEVVDMVPRHMRATYPAVMAVLTFILWLPTLRTTFLSAVTLGLVVAAFLFDVPAQLGSQNFVKASCVCALCASSLALYGAAMQIVNAAWDRDVLPRFAVPEKKPNNGKEGLSVDVFFRLFDAYVFAQQRCLHIRPVMLKNNEEAVCGSQPVSNSYDCP